MAAYDEKSADEKKAFAQEQYDFLRAQGVHNKLQLSRIFKAAGPGQIQEAWKLATCEDWKSEKGQIRKDLLNCVLCSSDYVGFGRRRMELVLESVGFPIPEAHNSKCFFRILDGAAEILVPGSFEFTPEELKELEDGLIRTEESEAE